MAPDSLCISNHNISQTKFEDLIDHLLIVHVTTVHVIKLEESILKAIGKNLLSLLYMQFITLPYVIPVTPRGNTYSCMCEYIVTVTQQFHPHSILGCYDNVLYIVHY